MEKYAIFLVLFLSLGVVNCHVFHDDVIESKSRLFSNAEVSVEYNYINLTFLPPSLDNVFMGSEYLVEVNVTMNCSAVGENLVLLLSSNDDRTARILQPELRIPLHCFSAMQEDIDACGCGLNFSVDAHFLGRAFVSFTVSDTTSNDQQQLEKTYEVKIIKPPTIEEAIFNIMLQILIAINNLAFGCGFELRKAKKTLKKPLAPILGLLTQSIVLPLLAFGYGKAVNLAPDLAFGLLAAGSAPSGGLSNSLTLLLEGDVMLSLCMTFFSNIVTLGSMPLWLYTLGPLVYEGSEFGVPIANIFISLAVFVACLFLGVLVRKFLPKIAKVIVKVHKFIAILYLLFIATFGTYNYLYVYTVMERWQVTVSGILLPWTGTVIAVFIGLIARLPKPKVLTIAIETAMQNVALALVLLDISLESPDNYLASAICIVVYMFGPFPWYFLLIGKAIKEKGACLKPKAWYDFEDEDNEKNEKEKGMVRSESTISTLSISPIVTNESLDLGSFVRTDDRKENGINGIQPTANGSISAQKL